MKELILVLTLIILLTGVPHTLLHSSLLVNVIIGFTIFTGFFGLHCMYTSLHAKDEKRRWLLLLMGAVTLLIAYFSLEFALTQRR